MLIAWLNGCDSSFFSFLPIKHRPQTTQTDKPQTHRDDTHDENTPTPNNTDTDTDNSNNTDNNSNNSDENDNNNNTETNTTQDDQTSPVDHAAPKVTLPRLIREDFLSCSGAFELDTSLDGQTCSTPSRRWRASSSGLILRPKKRTLFLRRTSTAGYFYTRFDDHPIDLSRSDARIQIDGSIPTDGTIKLLLYDGTTWYLSEHNLAGTSMAIASTAWRPITVSETLNRAWSNPTNALPTAPLQSSGTQTPDTTTIQGMGIEYTPTSTPITFRLDGLRLIDRVASIDIYTQHIRRDHISRRLFGLCVTPSGRTTNKAFLDHFSQWVEYLRWPGGSMIEDYNIRTRGSSTNYGIGTFIHTVRSAIPSMQFLIGVSTKKVATKELDAQSYVTEMIHYLERDYATKWGANPPLSAPAPFGYLGIGNEPGLVSEVTPTDTISAIRAYANGAHAANPSIKLLGPTTINGNINSYLKTVLKSDAGDDLDIVDTHHYTDSPYDYARDIRIVRDHIARYLHDTSRRKKSEVGIAFSEYNSLYPDKRKGIYYNESWGKAIWQSQTLSYFILGGVEMASLWHANMGISHSAYSRDGSIAYPVHDVQVFWHDRIDFDHHPRLLHDYVADNRLVVVPIQTDLHAVIFVTNPSPTESVTATIRLPEYRTVDTRAKIETLTRQLTGGYYAPKTITAGRVNVETLKTQHPNARVTVLSSGKTQIELPKYTVKINTAYRDLASGSSLSYAFPAYSTTAITLP